MKHFSKIATAALISVLILIFVGAIVRVTGAGLGCPDWPKCWGCYIPPSKIEDVDFKKIDFSKFEKKAHQRHLVEGEVNEQSLRKIFNPRHVWTEYVNRLFSLPVGIFSLATFIMSFAWRQKKPMVFYASFFALLLVLFNAWLGRRVVLSGLQPGIITVHMALALLLIIVQSYIIWHGKASMPLVSNNHIRSYLIALFLLVFIEGVMGSQVREYTDELSKTLAVPRSEWIGKLETSFLYLMHRSFSWLIVFLTIFIVKKHQGKLPWMGKVTLIIVLSQMLLGIIMARIHIFGVAQVLHVGLAACLVMSLTFWILTSTKSISRTTI